MSTTTLSDVPQPSKAHESTIVTHANPPKDVRALRARALLARLVQEAGPVPTGYKPDETVTEDGSQVLPEAAYQRQQDILPNQSRPRKNDAAREKEAQEFLEKQRGEGYRQRRTTERKRGDADEFKMKIKRRTAGGKSKGGYTEPEWASNPTEKYELVVYKKQKIDHTINLSTKSHIIVGRMTDCDIQIPSNSISRYHAVFQHGQDGMYIYDLGSSNGTFLNDHNKLINDGLIPKRQYKRILSSDIIMFGEHEFFYVLQGGKTRQTFDQSKLSNANHRALNLQGFQFQVKDKRNRERDYQAPNPAAASGGRRDIRSAKDHFRARFEKMKNNS